jgi:hypothetical protein
VIVAASYQLMGRSGDVEDERRWMTKSKRLGRKVVDDSSIDHLFVSILIHITQYPARRNIRPELYRGLIDEVANWHKSCQSASLASRRDGIPLAP